MKYLKMLLLVISSVGMAVFLLYGPSWLDEAIDRDIYLDWMKGARDETWKGSLILWSLYKEDDVINREWLSDTIKKYEKKHPGIYVEIQNFTPEESYLKIQRGLQPPDLYLFPEACPPQNSDIDIRFSLPLPEEDNTIKSEFEFDILLSPLPSSTPKPVQNCCIFISSIDSEASFEARSLAAFIADTAQHMVQ